MRGLVNWVDIFQRFGRRLSLAMANGNREVAMIPAKAIAVNTVTANAAK